MLTTSFSQVAVLCYLPLHVIVGQIETDARQRRRFTLGSPHLIVAARGFPPRVAG
jgi:hypothetical protein